MSRIKEHYSADKYYTGNLWNGLQVFDELWNGACMPIRHLGVHTSRITHEAQSRQITLFDNKDYEKLEKLDRAIDSIRERFGADAVQRASFLKQKQIDHMGRRNSKIYEIE